MRQNRAFKEKSYAHGSLNIAIFDGILERFCSDFEEPLHIKSLHNRHIKREKKRAKECKRHKYMKDNDKNEATWDTVKTKTDGSELLSSSSSGSRNSGSIWILSSDPVSGLKIQIQIQHSWIFHFLELKFSWISNFLEFTFSWIAIFVDWNFFEMKSSWIQTFFNENSFKKMWIQEDFNPENFESRKMKNSGMLDLNLHFKHCTWIWTSNSDWSWVSTSWTWRTQEFIAICFSFTNTRIF